MSVSSLSSSRRSFHHANFSSINSNILLEMYCLISRPSSFNFTSYIIIKVLLLPLCIFVIYHGLQQWRQKHSTSSAAATSHSDSFTYHMVTMELLRVFGCILSGCGIYREDLVILLAGYLLLCFTWFGEVFIHVLTCVERYLAVVHPITYLSLRKERGIRIRNIIIGCVWLFCFVGTTLMQMENLTIVANFFLTIFSLTVVSFCSLSVLCVLIRPGPGEQGGRGERVDQSKQKAFYTIVIILGVLVMRLSWGLAWSVLSISGRSSDCMILTSSIWFNLPSALVLPLLFLQRAGKLVCFKNNIQRE